MFSARDQDGLKRQRQSFGKYFGKITTSEASTIDVSVYLRDLAFTLCVKRSQLLWKMYIVASSIEELRSKLEDENADSLVHRSIIAPRIGFIFTGQGAQWARMGLELFQFPVFRKSIEDAEQYLRSHLGCTWSTVKEMHRDEVSSKINLPEYSQPICTILQVALVDLLQSWNITPCSIAGHSSGEMAGAYCLGALSREDAWRIAYYRGLLSSQIETYCPDQQGAMLAVGASVSQAEAWISQVSHGRIVVACVNSPSSVTISGDASDIDELHALLKKKDIFARKLKVTTAYHSPHMQMIAAPYFETISTIRPLSAREPRKMYSAVSGRYVDAAELGPVYWVRNLVSPVLFSDAVYEVLRPIQSGKRTTDTAVDILLEIGPHAALQGPVNQIMKEHSITGVDYLSVLSRGRNGLDTALSSAGALFVQGVTVNLREVNADTSLLPHEIPRPLVSLPSYQWNHLNTYWGESRISRQYRLREFPQLSLLGAPCPIMGESERLWRKFLRISEEQWIRDHQIQGSILYPAAGYIAMAIEAVGQTAETGRVISEFKLRDVLITAAVVITETASLECIFQLRPHLIGTRDRSSTWFQFTVSTCANGKDLRQNCSGLIMVEYENSNNAAVNSERSLENQALKDQYYEAEKFCDCLEDPQDFYKELPALGLMYGPDFQKVSRIQKGPGRSCCAVDAFTSKVATSSFRPHVIHPATLDAMFHTIFAAFNGQRGQLKEAMVPTAIDEVAITAHGPWTDRASFKGFSCATKYGFRGLVGDLVMLDQMTMQKCVTVKGLCCTTVPGIDGPTDEAMHLKANNFCQTIVWEPAIQLLSADQQRQMLDAVATGDLSLESAQKFERLELVAFVYVRRALSQVSFEMIQSEHLKLLYKYMQERLTAVNEYTHPFQAITEDWHNMDKETEQIVENLVESECTGGKALCRLGRNLEDILLGLRDPIQLLADNDLRSNSLYDSSGMTKIIIKISEVN